MRILFIHAARECAPEYSVHYTLAAYADPGAVQCYFVQQSGAPESLVPTSAPNNLTSRVMYRDFGRNLAIEPRPTRMRRALMMAARFPASVIFLIRAISKIHPDVIYTSQQGIDLLLATLVCRLFRIPHFIHLHYRVGPWWSDPLHGIVRRARHLLAVSDFTREWAIRSGVDPRHIDTLHNPLRPRATETLVSRQAIREMLGLPADARIVIAVGRLDPGKGHLRLLDAFARVCQEVPTAHLLICGRTFSRTAYDLRIKRRAQELGIETRVTFAGYREDIPRLLAGSDVFCLPTVLEPLGLVFLEAMEAGLPCIACRSGGVPEVIVQGETGLLSEPGDVGELAANLARVLCDQELANRLGAAGQRRVHAVFSPELIAAAWVQLLKKHFCHNSEQSEGHPVDDGYYVSRPHAGSNAV
jgi:glycosyltransferase involved in cell wall biosynthesis